MAKDPSVDIIYVAPFEIQKDVFEYYMKFLQVNRHSIQHEMRALISICFSTLSQLGCEGDIASRIKVGRLVEVLR